MLERRLLRHIDWYLVGLVSLLVAVGMLAIFSATHRGLPGIRVGPYYFLIRQAAAAVVGVILAGLALMVDYRRLADWARPLYAGAVVALLFVLVTEAISGASSWIRLGSLSIQPSEPAKLVLIIVLARYLEAHPPEGRWRDLWVPFLITGLLLLLLLLQPDFGTAIVFVGILFGMLFVAGANPVHLAVVAGSGIGLMVLAAYLVLHGVDLKLIHDYQIRRLLVFLNPYQDATGDGYNVIQSMIAVGSGGLTGKGLFSGSQTQLSFLPARHTDFIFSVVGEELGFIGATSVLVLFFLLLWRAVQVMQMAKDVFGLLICAGIVSMLTVHLLVNVGMTVGLMPVTGIPLPFLSYGGSSLVTNLVAVALLLNVEMRRHKILF
ncbi:MAG: rod shape-determining protein RodA [Limnochordales bacterium]|nr:rod shape-determining protein RodA [Limnochordales bacterium]